MRSIAILVSLLLSTGVSQAQTLADSIANCSQQTDSLKRLVCYDKIAKKIATQTTVAEDIQAFKPESKNTPAPASISSSAQEAPVITAPTSEKQIKAKSAAESQFGMEHKIVQDKIEDKIYARVSSISKDPYGKLLVLLDNDQTWKQVDSNNLRLKVGERLYIERGVLGSFYMSKDDVNRRVRVKRTK